MSGTCAGLVKCLLSGKVAENPDEGAEKCLMSGKVAENPDEEREVGIGKRIRTDGRRVNGDGGILPSFLKPLSTRIVISGLQINIVVL